MRLNKKKMKKNKQTKKPENNNKKGKRYWAILEQECKGLSASKLVSYMEKQKSILKKLNRRFF